MSTVETSSRIAPPKKLQVGLCPICAKRPAFCPGHEAGKLPQLDTRLEILFLQHPQEPDVDLGTARLAALSLPRSKLAVGLSWPNLAKALGRNADPKKWGVLYLGSGIHGATARIDAGLYEVNKKGEVKTQLKDASSLEGIVLIDGTWSQAKAIWWRNAWLLKLRRLILAPGKPSAYGKLRKEPRRECLSTLETTAECLTQLNAWSTPKGDEKLRAVFAELLEKFGKRRAEKKQVTVTKAADPQ